MINYPNFSEIKSFFYHKYGYAICDGNFLLHIRSNESAPQRPGEIFKLENKYNLLIEKRPEELFFKTNSDGTFSYKIHKGFLKKIEKKVIKFTKINNRYNGDLCNDDLLSMLTDMFESCLIEDFFYRVLTDSSYKNGGTTDSLSIDVEDKWALVDHESRDVEEPIKIEKQKLINLIQDWKKVKKENQDYIVISRDEDNNFTVEGCSEQDLYSNQTEFIQI